MSFNRSLVEQKMQWCVHYNGIIGRAGENPEERTCKAGVKYRSVREDGRSGLEQYPCFQVSGLCNCPMQQFPTLAEAEELERKTTERLNQWAADLDADICPHCKTPITRYRQVVRSVYASPCGHRLYQGRVTHQPGEQRDAR